MVSESKVRRTRPQGAVGARAERSDVPRPGLAKPPRSHREPPAVAITDRGVRAAIDAIEADYRWCWDILVALRTGRMSPTAGESLVRFQIRLFDAIHRLERLYVALKHEQKRLVSGKARYAPTWFRRRMAMLHSRCKLLRSAIGMGRTLGDGFAWFFYERDRNLIAEHLQHQRQILLPTGIGGQGERAMLENLQGVGRMLLIYHGTTSFLRMGDVTLIDLKTFRVAAIGELKTQQIDERQLSLKLALISGRRDLFPDLANSPSPPAQSRPLDAKVETRLKRQTKRMGDAFGRAHSAGHDPFTDSPGEFHFAELDDVIARSGSRRLAYVRAGRSLVVAALRQRKGRPLSARLRDWPINPDRALVDVAKWATSVTSAELPDNSLLLGRVSASTDDLIVTTDALPISWWPLKEDALRALIFGEVMLLTIYNPAHFWAALRARGFELSIGDHASVRRAVKVTPDRELHLEHADYFQNLVQRSFMSLDSALLLVDQLMSLAEEKTAEGFRKIQMRPLITRGAAALAG